jgi:hypothetical protein
VDEYPDPEAALIDRSDAALIDRKMRAQVRLSPEQRADLARWRAGEVIFVRVTEFAEFDAGEGPQRWEDTPQGPYAVPVGVSATSTLLDLVENSEGGSLLGELGISGLAVSRWEFAAAPRRIDVDDAVTRRLTLD